MDEGAEIFANASPLPVKGMPGNKRPVSDLIALSRALGITTNEVLRMLSMDARLRRIGTSG